MAAYTHRVQYYETDKMGITHHSNYIRWMEEARVDLLTQLGWGYERLEEMGLASPVMSVDCEYRGTTTFADVISIDVTVVEFRGIRLKLAYEMKKQDGTLVCRAHSEHCFLGAGGRIMNVKKEYPELYAALTAIVG